MPYPRAFYYMLGVIAVIVIGFWPSYFAVGTQVPWREATKSGGHDGFEVS